MDSRMIRRRGHVITAGAVAAVIAGVGAAATSASIPPIPIPSDPTTAPKFVGHAADAHPIAQNWRAPRHPFMAPNGRSNLHNDAYQTDAYRRSGPLGRDLRVNSTDFSADCGSLTFDSEGRIETVCIGLAGPKLYLLNSKTLATIATHNLPPRQAGGGDPFTNVSGGGYFYLDNRDRAVIPTTTRHIYVIRQTSAPGFQRVRDYDLSHKLGSDDSILSALPDWHGRLWFVSTQGVVGWVGDDGHIHARNLGEEIANSFAVDDHAGVFIVTTKALYRLHARHGHVHVDWRRPYPNSGVHKPGQLSAGSGTTPTLIGKDRVAITDNADPMHVVVYHRSARSGGREICHRAVFEKGASDTENSLIAAGRSLVVENNYGYTVTHTEGGGVTSPGISRVVVDHGRCKTKWTSEVRAPSVVPKASLGNGLVYTYTKPKTKDHSDAWYFTALDFRTGKTVYKRLTGAGLGYNNHYAPVSIGPDGTAYVGVLGGLLRIADS